jgi:hypothetical protein
MFKYLCVYYRKLFSLIVLCAVSWLSVYCNAQSETAVTPQKSEVENSTLSAKDIMALALNRNDGSTQYARQKLISCRYALKGKKIVCAEKPRMKVFEFFRKDYGVKEKDRRSISILLDPPVEKGISFLQYDYEDQNRESDQWMYLSALG